MTNGPNTLPRISLKERMKIASVSEEAIEYTPLETKPVGASSYSGPSAKKLEVEKFKIDKLSEAVVVISPVETMRVSGKEPIEKSLKQLKERHEQRRL